MQNKKNILRPLYYGRIEPFIGKDLIKVITGQRRVGKSFFLKQLRDRVTKQTDHITSVYVDKEDPEFEWLKTGADLIDYVKKRRRKGYKTALFIDEVQEIDQFEKALRGLLSTSNTDIYCTGSNSRMLSGELATLLSGRYIEIRMHSLSYAEFLMFHDLSDSRETFFRYVRQGGMPFTIHLPDQDEVVLEYLKSVFNTIVVRDIINRYGTRNIQFLERLMLFIADNLGSIISARKISEYLKSQQIRMSAQIVLDYLSHAESAMIIHKARRFDVEGKRIFEIGEKYFFEDLGLRHAVMKFQPKDLGKILENLVYRHLILYGYEVFIGRVGQEEIDFVARKRDSMLYFQVAWQLASEETWNREYRSLLRVNDNFAKYLITAEAMPGTGDYMGIEHLSIREFLLRDW